MKPSVHPSVQPATTNQLINQSINQSINWSINQSINQSFVLGSFGLSVSSLLVLLIPSFVPSFIQLRAKMSLFCRSSWIPPFSKGSTSLAKEETSINQSIILSSSGLFNSVFQLVFYSSSFLYLFIHLVPICPCFAGAVEFFLSVRVQLLLQQKEHTINHSFPWARSVLQSVSRSSSFLPSYLPSFMHSLY